MKIMHSVAPLLLLVMLASTLGCNTRAKFQEVSQERAYSGFIGAEYVLNVPMHLSGVNLPPGYRKVIDVYRLNPVSRTWTGPELVTRETLPPGTLLVVESIHRCTNCILDFKDRLEAQVRIVNHGTKVDRPIMVSLDFLEAEFARRR